MSVQPVSSSHSPVISLTLEQRIDEWVLLSNEFHRHIRERISVKIKEFLADQSKTDLDLSGLELDDLPSIMIDPIIIARLKSLDISNNELTFFPRAVCQFTQLTHLEIRDNPDINDLPEELRALTLLEELDASIDVESDDDITTFTLPNSLFGLQHLKKIFLGCRGVESQVDSLAQVQSLQTINLFRTLLTEFPSTLFLSLPNLDSLDLTNNHITALPLIQNGEEDFVFRNPIVIEMAHNPIQSIDPMFFSSQATNCSISLTLAGMERALRNQVITSLSEDVLEGATFSIDDVDQISEVPNEILSDAELSDVDEEDFSGAHRALLDQLFSEIKIEAPENISQILQHEKMGNLAELTERLLQFFPMSHSLSPSLYTILARAIQDSCESPEYREFFLEYIRYAASTCGDRIILTFLMIGLKRQEFFIDPKNGSQVFPFCRSLFIMDYLEKRAVQLTHVMEVRRGIDNIDPIEVFLVLPISLKERFSLPLQVDDMLFRTYSRISDELIYQIGNEIDICLANKDSDKEKNPFLKFLTQCDLWKKCLEYQFPKEIEDAKQKVLDESDYEAFDTAVVALTAQVLGSPSTAEERALKRKRED